MPIFAGLKLQEQSWTRPPIYELLRSRVRAIAGKPPPEKEKIPQKIPSKGPSPRKDGKNVI